MENKLLRELLPDVAEELEKLLLDDGLLSLAEQVASLYVIDRCRCGDHFCASFYTMPKPEGAWGPNHENIVLAPKLGAFILDVVDGRIAYVEVHNRDDIREMLIDAVT